MTKHEHCWHNTGIAEYQNGKMKVEKMCCHCGKVRKFRFSEGDNVIVHGKYLVENRMLKFDVK